MCGFDIFIVHYKYEIKYFFQHFYQFCFLYNSQVHHDPVTSYTTEALQPGQYNTATRQTHTNMTKSCMKMNQSHVHRFVQYDPQESQHFVKRAHLDLHK